ncbi:MAG: trypsin-like serine protease [Acidimicrobiia bacterium]
MRRGRRMVAGLVAWGLVGGGPAVASAQQTPDKGPSEEEVTAPERVQPRIVGGSPAPAGAYPWHVALDFGPGLSQCGGSLVSSRWVMTAAHCLHDVGAGQLVVKIGRNVLSDTSQGEVRNAAQILIHPSYDDHTTQFDIALVRLDTPATHRWARPAQPGDPYPPGTALRAIGHGATCELGCAGSDQLLQVDLPVQSDATMQQRYGSAFDPATMLGAGPLQGGLDTCFGDSGGPLFVPGPLQAPVPGITSFGAGCARPDAPGIYAEVAAPGLRSFVTANVGRPAHDNFASAASLSGPSGQVNGTNTDAVGEPGEPAHAGSEADTTVWYAWTAPSSAPVTLTVPTASFDPTLAVYTGGSVTSLSQVAANDDANALLPAVTFTPQAGVTYRIAVDGYNAQWGTFQLRWSQATAGSGGATVDFTGDGRADPSIYRPSTGQWFVHGGNPGLVTWGGLSGDIPVPADYTGDGRADAAIYRPSTGQWFVHGGNPGLVTWGGLSEDIPVPADYTGDGRADAAIYRPSTGQWFVHGGNPALVTWGASGAVPVPDDYTGDGRADVAVYVPSTGQWFLRGADPGLVTWGGGGADVPVLLPAAVYDRFF